MKRNSAGTKRTMLFNWAPEEKYENIQGYFAMQEYIQDCLSEFAEGWRKGDSTRLLNRVGVDVSRSELCGCGEGY